MSYLLSHSEVYDSVDSYVVGEYFCCFHGYLRQLRKNGGICKTDYLQR